MKTLDNVGNFQNATCPTIKIVLNQTFSKISPWPKVTSWDFENSNFKCYIMGSGKMKNADILEVGAVENETD